MNAKGNILISVMGEAMRTQRCLRPQHGIKRKTWELGRPIALLKGMSHQAEEARWFKWCYGSRTSP